MGEKGESAFSSFKTSFKTGVTHIQLLREREFKTGVTQLGEGRHRVGQRVVAHAVLEEGVEYDHGAVLPR